jgi:glycosyltransferase involved in cell wall biosynthesis
MKRTDSVSVVSFAHLGYDKDLKSLPTYFSIKSLANTGMVRNVFVVDIEETYDIDPALFEIPIPGGKTVPRALYLIDSILPRFDARNKIIAIFDCLTSRKIGAPETLHSFPHLTKTIATAKASGTTAAVYASSSHPKHVQSLLAEERNHLNINSSAEIERRILEGFELADYILYLNEYSKETFIEYGFKEEKLLKVGPLAADLDTYTPENHSDERFVVVSVANMRELKGIHYLIEAWKQLKIPDAQLILCGTMNDAVAQTVGSTIKERNDIEHVGYVDDPSEYLKQASVLVHPSLSESFSKAVAEGMASSLPVIITEHGPREYVDDAGFVVPIRDPDAIADRLRYLYDHPDEARQMGERGREIVEANTWDDFSERVKQAHEEILSRES